MEPGTLTVRQPRSALTAGWILSALPVLFLLFDAGMHIANPAMVVQASIQLGYDPWLMRPIGVVELAGLLAYIAPRTSMLGAILMTGYLGGATATKVRMEDVWFILPVVLGALLWLGLYLRDPRLRSLLPLRTGGRT